VAGQRHRTRRRRELSQHFLRSRGLAASLVAQSSISSRDLVVEIGPGRGILTRELAERCSHLVAVELDHQLFAGLRKAFHDSPHIELVRGDFLHFTLPDTPYKVFGNIPFGQTAPIVRRLVEAPTPPDDVYCVVQREAGEGRLGAAVAGPPPQTSR